MSEVFDRAMDRVRDEMAKDRSPGVQGVGEFVTAILQQRPEWAEQIGAEGKSLKELYKKMEDAAKKQKTGSCYYMSQTEALNIACEYYGLTGERPDLYAVPTAASTPPSAPAGSAQASAPAPEPVDELDALLAGL